MFGKDREEKDDAGQQTLPGTDAKKPAKTTPDEGRTFDRDTVFVCVTDCWDSKTCTRYRKGDEKTGRKCPAHFVVKPKAEEKKE